MRFMMLMIPKGYETAKPGTMPEDAERIAAMMKYNEDLQKAGVLRALDGLHPPSMGARVSFAGGKPLVTDGPFAEAKEVLGGYWMIDVGSRQEAIDWAKRCPASANEVIEIRQVQEMSDFPEHVQNVVEGFEDMQAAIGQKTSADATAGQRKPQSGGRSVPQLNTYLFFTGRCEEALTFYQQVLGGEITAMMRYKDTPEKERLSAEWHDKVIHACLEVGDRKLMASDGPPSYERTPQGFDVQLDIAEPEEADRIYNALLEGGQARLPLDKTFFARRFGMLVDRFGTPWMINCR
jgi:PhnB protein